MAREPTPGEKAKIAAGPRFDPGKPKPPWRERKAPKPVSKVAAPPLPPPPKPPVPTLEPVIPQPYIEPKDAKVIETDAKGNPTKLQTPDGEKHYTPYHTTMWGELGFKTDKEYLQSQRTGQPSQYVGITKGVEKPIRVSRGEMIKAAELKGDKQFEAYKALGVIPRGSKFLPGPGGYQGVDWGYIHPNTLKKEKGRLIARQFASIREPGFDWRLVTITQEFIRRIPKITEVDSMSRASRKMTGRELLSILSPTTTRGREDFANLPFLTKLKMLKDKGIKAEQAKVAAGVIGMSASAERVETEAWAKLTKLTEGMKPVSKFVAKGVGAAAVYGLFMAPVYQGVIAGQLAKTAWHPQKVEHLKDVGTGIVNYFKSIPGKYAIDPALATGELVGLFILGPGGVVKMLKGTAARFSPAYIPKRGMAIEYSVSRVPVDKIGKVPLTNAVNKAIKQALMSKKGTATVKIGKGNLKIKLRSTPVSETVGPALYHATPELSPALMKGAVKGKLFTSPHLAPRFADSSAAGVPGGKPAILMIFTKNKGVKWQPTHNLWKKTKEIEAIYPSGTQLARVKSFRSRLFGEKAGDFITTHDGNIIPIYRFAEQGANVPAFGLAELATVRLKALQASILDLVKGKKGYELIKGESWKALSRRIAKDAEKEVKKGKTREKAFDIVTRRELSRLYERNPKLLERLYRENAERFEARYLERIGRELDRLRRQPFRERISRIPERLRAETTRQRLERERLERTRLERTRLERQRLERPRIERTRLERTRLERQRIERTRLERTRLEKLRLREERLREDRLKLREDKVVTDAGRTDKKNRKIVSRSKGALAWRHGELRGKDVWHVGMYPYTSEADYLVVVGRKPTGATIVKGPGSARQSIRLLYGKAPPKTVTGDLGFFDFAIEPTGVETVDIRFTPDPKLETTGDITIGRRTPPITERQTGLGHGKSPRITPKTPRLRR